MIRKPIVALCACACLAACGAGTGTDQLGGINGGGAPVAASAVGTITGFGSVFVNGIEFATGSATITLGGNVGTESQLSVGQVVEVRGTINPDGTTGTATTINFDNVVEGPVQSIDLAGGTFSVLGQLVRVTGTTVFDEYFADPSIAGVTVGQAVEVSGFRNSADEIVATRIGPQAMHGVVEVSGVVGALDTTAQTAVIGPTTVSYAGATISNGSLVKGACVRVRGTSVAGATLAATNVDLKPCALKVATNDEGRLEGIVTRFVSTTQFDLNGQAVTTDAKTLYKGGVAADLALNRHIEVEGKFDGSGVLLARRIELEADISAALTGTVDSLNSTQRSLSIFGVTIGTGDTTMYDDRSSAHIRTFKFGELRTGDYLEIRGSAGSSPLTATARRIVRRNLIPRSELFATAQNVSSPTFTLLGVMVTTSATTNFHGLTQAQFFLQASGRNVKVVGSFDGASFTATDAVLEPLDP